MSTYKLIKHEYLNKKKKLCVLGVLCGEITCNFLSNLFGQPKNLINFANLLRNNKKLII